MRQMVRKDAPILKSFQPERLKSTDLRQNRLAPILLVQLLSIDRQWGAFNDQLTCEGRIACCECGSPSITIPGDLADDAPVSCGGCDSVIGSWLGYKSFVSRSITLEAHGFPNTPLICVDPILMQPFEDALADHGVICQMNA